MKNNGFTLIELLAVIVILAIIALIASPIIIGLIDDARKEAFKDTGYGIVTAGELLFSKDLLNGTTKEVTFTYNNGVETSTISGKTLEYSGSKPKTGTVKVNIEGQVAIAIHNGTYCVEKGYNDSEITLSDKIEADCKLPFECGTDLVDSRDSNVYKTVKIGNQCWMAENLKYTGNGCLGNTWDTNSPHNACKKATETELTENSSNSEWLQHEVWYQWDATMNGSTTEGAQGVCPDGWHVPSDTEWKTLEMSLGMSQTDADATDYRGTDQGDQLKSESPSWCYGTTNCATSGFNATFAGICYTGGLVSNVGTHSYWWTSSISDTNALWRSLDASHSGVLRVSNSRAFGNLVRCLLG